MTERRAGDDVDGDNTFDELRCRLCWQTFDSPGELAEHEQQEEDRLYPIDGNYVDTTNGNMVY